MEYDRYQQLNKATKTVIENKMGEHGDIISALEVVKETNQSYGIDYADYAANLLTDFVKDGDGVEDIDEVIEELKKINANKFNGTISELNQYK
jgi:thymidylate synthase